MTRNFLPFLAVLTLTTGSVVQAARVYYVNQPEGTPGVGEAGVIQVMNPDGTNHQAHYIAGSPTDLRGIAVDPENNRLFFAYCELSGGVNPVQVSLRTLPLTGAGAVATSILTLPDGPAGSGANPLADVEYDPSLQQVYFSQPSSKRLRRCEANGEGLTDVLTHPATGDLPRDVGPYFFGLDLIRRDAYWAVLTISGDTNTGYTRGSLAGVVDPAFTLITPSRTRDIAVMEEPGEGARLFWNDRQNGAVYSRLATGGAVSTVASGLNAPHGLAVDSLARKGYASDTGKRGSGSQLSSHRVVRFNLDGSGPLEYISPASATAEPWDVALDLSSTSLSDWSRRFFAQGAVNNQAADDPDGDGLTNKAEYAFFCSPLRADAWQAAQVFDLRAGKLRVALRKITDVNVRVEVSTDLTEWHWNGDGTGITYHNLSDPERRDEESEWHTVTPAIEEQSRFLIRLRAL